jgi:hypothetical protein
MSFRLAQRSFDLASNARDRLYARAFELGNLNRGAEHVSDEGCVAEDFVRMTGQFELLDDLGAFVDIQYDACSCYAETGIGVAEGLYAAEAGIGRDERAVERPEAVHVLGCVF